MSLARGTALWAVGAMMADAFVALRGAERRACRLKPAFQAVCAMRRERVAPPAALPLGKRSTALVVEVGINPTVAGY